MRINANDVPPMPDADQLDEDQLDDPTPLVAAVGMPPFPVDSLPAAYAEMVASVAEACQVDAAMPASAALAALSACSGGHAVIELRSGWQEPLNLSVLIVASPGERKSAVMQALTGAPLDVEQQLADTGMAARLEAETQKRVAEESAQRAKQQAATKFGDDGWDSAMADAIGAAQFAADITVPAVPRLVADEG